MAIDLKRLTSDDLAALADDGKMYELVDGELVQMGPPGYQHGKIVTKISRAVGNFVERESLGDVLSNSGFRIRRDPDTVLSPDVAFVRASALSADLRSSTGYPDFAPELVFEVVSPSDSANHMQEKLEKYTQAEVPAVAIVWPQTKMVTVHFLGDGVRTFHVTDRIDFGDILPGFSLAVSDIFA